MVVGAVTVPRVADQAAGSRRARHKPLAVDARPGLGAVVARLLKLGWSPASIAGRLPADHPGEDAWRVSHEAIYQWVYAQPVASLRAELIALRTGRTRRSGPRPAPAPRIREPRYLDERPAEAQGVNFQRRSCDLKVRNFPRYATSARNRSFSLRGVSIVLRPRVPALGRRTAAPLGSQPVFPLASMDTRPVGDCIG
jgi:hypothetical protein